MRLPGLEPQKGRVMRHPIEDFPFRIGDVQRLMGLQPVRIHSGNSDFNCIFCGGKGKMNINYVKNVYGCVKCGAGGGMVDLYASYYHLTAKEAYDEICQKLSFEESVERAGIRRRKQCCSRKHQSFRRGNPSYLFRAALTLNSFTKTQGGSACPWIDRGADQERRVSKHAGFWSQKAGRYIAGNEMCSGRSTWILSG